MAITTTTKRQKTWPEKQEKCYVCCVCSFPLHFSSTLNFPSPEKQNRRSAVARLSPSIAYPVRLHFVHCNHAIMLPTSELLMAIGVNVRTTFPAGTEHPIATHSFSFFHNNNELAMVTASPCLLSSGFAPFCRWT